MATRIPFSTSCLMPYMQTVTRSHISITAVPTPLLALSFTHTLCLVLQQQLRHLHRVQSRALLDLVAAHKQVQALGVSAGDVAPHTPHVHIVLISGVQRHGETAGVCGDVVVVVVVVVV